MNRFEIDLLKQAYQNYEQTGNPEAFLRVKSADDWFYYSESIRFLAEEGYIEVNENFDPDESDLFVVARPIAYVITAKGIAYVKENLKT